VTIALNSMLLMRRLLLLLLLLLLMMMMLMMMMGHLDHIIAPDETTFEHRDH
jgi:hypothetical protein